MAHSISAKKRAKQNESRRQRNQARKSELKTRIRKVEDLLKAKDLQNAQEQFRLVTKRLDQVASTSSLHKNAADRQKSRLARMINNAKAKVASPAE